MSDIISYIREATQQGIGADQLRVSLMEVGWREADVENALRDAALPSTWIGPDHELPAPAHHSAWFRHVVALLWGAVVFLAVDQYASIWAGTHGLVPSDQTLFTGALGAVFLVVSYVLLRLHRAWPSSLLTESAIAILASALLVAFDNQLIELSTTIASGALLGVVLVVMERWIDTIKI